MSDVHDFIGIIVYAPALVRGDSRPLTVVRGMERTYPGLHLDSTISEEGRLVPLPQRDAWVTQGASEGDGFPLVCNGDEGSRVIVYGLEIAACNGPGGQPLFDIHAHLPPSAVGIAAAVDVLEGSAEDSNAFWGHATPLQAGAEIAQQMVHSVRQPGALPRGLPALKLREHLRAPEIPHHLGWLNYWAASTARILEFPHPSRDADLLSRARRTETGGWVIQLTEAPLDLNDPTHLEVLLRAYERFPEIGGRKFP